MKNLKTIISEKEYFPPLIKKQQEWEEKNKLYKAISYFLKSLGTIIDLLTIKPKLILIQLPPTPALYLVGTYARLAGIPYIADCHNAMFMEWWINWPFAKTLLKKAAAVLVHNKDVCDTAKRYDIDAIVVRDPLPKPETARGTNVINRFSLISGKYVLAPWNLASDEPIAEFIEAVKKLPHIKFAMTWFTERLPAELRHNLPENLIFTGYLEIDEFNQLFVNAGAAISLTTLQGIQPSAAAEAIAFGVPIILTESETARQLYKDIPVYVENEAESIEYGIKEVFANRAQYINNVESYKNTLVRELEKEVVNLKTIIAQKSTS